MIDIDLLNALNAFKIKIIHFKRVKIVVKFLILIGISTFPTGEWLSYRPFGYFPQALLRLQRRACRIILDEQYTTLNEALNQIYSLNIKHRILLQNAKFMYRVSQNAVPSYIHTMFNTMLRVQIIYVLQINGFLIPKPNTELFKGSMSYS